MAAELISFSTFGKTLTSYITCTRGSWLRGDIDSEVLGMRVALGRRRFHRGMFGQAASRWPECAYGNKALLSPCVSPSFSLFLSISLSLSR